jgi:hypothetical protein
VDSDDVVGVNDMPERRTIEFRDTGVNILSDAERGTISLQLNSSDPIERAAAVQILKAIRKRFGNGDESNPLVLSPTARPHPENPEVICLEVVVKAGAVMEPALSSLIDFLRRQPGYTQTFGKPLDRDHAQPQRRKEKEVDAADAAWDALMEMMSRGKRTGS